MPGRLVHVFGIDGDFAVLIVVVEVWGYARK